MTTARETPPLAEQLASGLKESQLAGLDGLRAIAAFLVVFYHLEIPLVSGGAGVLMFFVLSGFLITWLLLRENDELGSVSLGRFYARRSLRLFPASYAFIACCTLLWLAGIAHLEARDLWYAATYTAS